MLRDSTMLDLLTKTSEELRQANDEVRELRSEKDRLEKIVADLNVQSETATQKLKSLQDQIDHLEQIISERYSAEEEKIKASYLALADREGKVLDQENTSQINFEQATNALKNVKTEKLKLNDACDGIVDVINLFVQQVLESSEKLKAALIAFKTE